MSASKSLLVPSPQAPDFKNMSAREMFTPLGAKSPDMSVTFPVTHSEMWPYVVVSPAHHAVTAVRRVSLVNEKQLVALAAPPVEYVPAGQVMSQFVWPSSTPKKPPGQGMQLA